VSVKAQHAVFTFGIPIRINPFHRSSDHSTCLYFTLAICYQFLFLLSLIIFLKRSYYENTIATYVPFTPSLCKSRASCMTAAAGTRIGKLFSYRSYHSFPGTVCFTKCPFVTYSRSLVQSFDHWLIFLTAASKWSCYRASVSMREDKLSFLLDIIALVSLYLTN